MLQKTKTMKLKPLLMIESNQSHDDNFSTKVIREHKLTEKDH